MLTENMDFLYTCVLAGTVAFLFLLYRFWAKKSYKFPPGPTGLPLLGSILNVSPVNGHEDFRQLSKRYGDVMSLNMAGNRIVVLNSADAIRDAFTKQEKRDFFAGRPDSFYVRYCDRGPSTVHMDYSEVYKLQRKFLIKTLKIFDDGDHTIENVIRQELNMAVKKIRDMNGKPFNIKDIVIPSLANILLILIGGKRYELDSPVLRATLDFDEIDAVMLGVQTINVLTVFPFLRFLPFGYGKLYRQQQKCLQDLLYHLFEIPKKTFDRLVTRGFVDNLFRLQGDNAWLGDENIKGIIRETIGAGLGTTRATIMAFFLIILHRQDVMKTIQEEIDSVIGRDRPPRVHDRGHMPYTEAVTMELQRYVSVTPLGAPHTTTADVEFRSYTLPKNTVVFANQWTAHHDDEVWEDPWVYRPERFLKDGKLLSADHKNRRNLIPFGVGRRACLGETFARSRVFLFITTLLQQFDFRPYEDEALPSHDPRGYDQGITIHAPTFKLRAFPRI